MQTELQSEHPELNIHILGINQPENIGQGGEALVAAISSLPMVQDDSTANIWPSWGGIWRDVYILDRQNEVLHLFNLTQHNLAPGHGFCSNTLYIDQVSCENSGAVWNLNYDYLKQLFIDAASR